MNTHRVVFDTNVLVSALMSPTGNPANVYRMFLAGTLTPVYSKEILEEYQDVLYRPQLRISTKDADMILDAILLCGECMQPLASTFLMTDETDRIFYDVAKAADAYLITGNSRHYPEESFILTPTEFLKLWTKP